jgi:hypothetical protein
LYEIEVFSTAKAASPGFWHNTPTMVFELLGLLGLPVSVATAEGIRHNKEIEKDQDDEEEHRMQDFHIEVFCDAESRKRDQVNETIVALKDGKVSMFISFFS